MKRLKPFEPNDKDLEIISLIYQHRFLSTDLLYLLVKESPDESKGERYGFGKTALYNRCQMLVKNRYLMRQFFTDQPIGRGYRSQPAVYSLGKASVEWIAHEFRQTKENLRKLIEQNRIGAHFLRHFMGIARLRVNLELACRQSNGTISVSYWKQGGELKDYVYTDPDVGEHRLSVFPDAFFSLDVEGRGRSHYMLEFDRSTESIKGRIREKLLAYAIYTNHKLYRRKYFYVKRHTGDRELAVREQPWDDLSEFEQGKILENAIKGVRILFLTKATETDAQFKTDNKRPQYLRQQNLIKTVQTIPILIDKDGKVSTTRFWFANELDFNLEDPNSVFKDYWVSSKQRDPQKYSLIH
ncbi:MAG: replication-relaxation family protein [Desulfobacterales bacterium]|nr:replication-relaxation family protein [Desulfobacterales bacterium]